MVNKQGILVTGARKGNKPIWDSCWKSLKILKNEGNLYRGVKVLVGRGALFSAGQQLGYDGFKTWAKT
jgi:hypothetical protein